MKAVIWTKYGPPESLKLQEIEKPLPGDTDVLIRVRATTVTAGDCEVRSLTVPLMIRLPMRVYAGLRRPKRLKILGQEVAGVVEAVGKDVTRFQPGDAVFGSTGFRMGAYAEYCCLSDGASDAAMTHKPDNLSFEEAAAVPLGGTEALHFLRRARIQPGERVLIVGAGGSIGTFGVQLAKHFGAVVTAVDRPEKFAMLRAIGAEHVVDYTKEDYTRQGSTYDVIFDVVGKSPYFRSMEILNPNGRYLQANPGIRTMIAGRLMGRQAGKKLITGTASYNTKDLEYLIELIEAGEIQVVIGRRFPLEQAAEAHRYVETGQKQGNLVLTVGEWLDGKKSD